MFNNLQRYKKNDKHTPLENLSLEAWLMDCLWPTLKLGLIFWPTQHGTFLKSPKPCVKWVGPELGW